MAVCYCCKITLNKSNYSWEHIIPSALGASLKSRRLICRSCPVYEQKTLGISSAMFNSNPFHILYIYANPADNTILAFLELFGEAEKVGNYLDKLLLS